MKTCVIVSGYFDPLHRGHVQYIEMARELGEYVIVIVNSDIQATLKKGKPFMDEVTRHCIVSALWCVYDAVISIDTDETVRQTIRDIYRRENENFDRFIFAKGGDRSASNVPEVATCLELNIDFVDGLGEKLDSSRKYYEEKN